MSSSGDPFLEEPPGGARPPSRSGHRFNPMSSGERSRSSSVSSPNPRRAAAHSGTPRSRAHASEVTEAQGRLYPTPEEILAWSTDQAADFVNENVSDNDIMSITAEGSVALFNVLERTYKLDIFDAMSKAFAILESGSHTWMSFRETSRLMRAASIREAQTSRSHIDPQSSDWATQTPRATRQGQRTRPVSPTPLHTDHAGEPQVTPDVPMNENTPPRDGRDNRNANGEGSIPPSILSTIDLIAASIRSLYIQLDTLPGHVARAARDTLHASFAPTAPTGAFTFHNPPTFPPHSQSTGGNGRANSSNTGSSLPKKPQFNNTMPRTPPPPRNRGPPPAVNRATRPNTSRTASYATVAKATPSDFLRQAGSILAAAPSITPEEALAIAKTVPIVAKPTASKGRKAVIQGTKASLAVATTTTLLSERAIPAIIAEIVTDQLLKDLPKTEVTISMNRYSAILNGGTSLSDEQKSAFIACVARATSTDQGEITSRARATHSVLKLDYIPARTILGPTTVSMVVDALSANAVFRAQQLFEPIVLIPNRRNPAFVTACIKVLDDRAGHVANSLLKQSILVCSEHREILVWENKATAKQCTQCQRWGHNHRTCKTRGAFCAICGGPHTTSTHNVFCQQCIADGDDPINCIAHDRCINCGGDHPATDHRCPWFKARSNPTEMKALQERKKTENAAARATRSATRRGPPSSIPQARSSTQPPRPPTPTNEHAKEPTSEEDRAQSEAMSEDNVTAHHA